MQMLKLRIFSTLLTFLLCSCLVNKADNEPEIIKLQVCACDTCSNTIDSTRTDTGNHNPIITLPLPTGLKDPCWVNENKDSIEINWIASKTCSSSISIHDDNGNKIKTVLAPSGISLMGLHRVFWDMSNDNNIKVDTEGIYRVVLRIREVSVQTDNYGNVIGVFPHSEALYEKRIRTN